MIRACEPCPFIGAGLYSYMGWDRLALFRELGCSLYGVGASPRVCGRYAPTRGRPLKRR